MNKIINHFLVFFMAVFLMQNYSFAINEIEFIQKVITQDEFFAKDQIYVDIKKIELDASRDNYENWKITLRANVINSEYDTDKDTNSKSIYEKRRIKNNKSSSISLEKRFLNNPSNLSIKIGRNLPSTKFTRYKNIDYYGNHEINTYDNTYKITYKYPLLKNDGNAESLKTYHRNILDLQREKLDFVDNKEAFLVKRLVEYLSLAKYQQQTKIHNQYLQQLTNVVPHTKDDSNALRVAINATNANILSVESKLKSAQKKLSIVLNDISFLTTKIGFKYHKKVKLIDNLEQYLYKNNRKLLKLYIDKQLKEIDIKYYKNQDLIALDFIASAEKNDNEGNTLTTIYNNNSTEYIAGLYLNIPLSGNITNAQNLSVSKLNLQKLNIDYAAKFKDIFADTKALEEDININEKSLHTFTEFINNIVKTVNKKLNEYKNKNIKIKDLIDFYKEERNINLSYLNIAIEHQTSILKYNDNLDRILSVN